MKGLKVWGWMLFAAASGFFWTGIINGNFNGHGIHRMNNGALMLAILSTVCFLLAVTVWVIANALQEIQRNNPQ